MVLVLEPEYGAGLMAKWQAVPLWIIDSPLNRPVIEKARSSDADWVITTFSLRDGESPATTCERIVDSLDQHHNECSQKPPYNELVVIGVPLSEVSLKPFLELNFTEFLQTASGFIARKT